MILFKYILGLCITLLLLVEASAQTNQVLDVGNAITATERANKLIDTLALHFLDKTKIPGMSVAISKNGKLVFAKGFGFANVKEGIKMRPNTQLRTASVSKLLTATAIGRLFSEGKLDLDAPIAKYVPYLDAKYAQLTTRQLAGHTAGVPHRPKGTKHKKRHYTTIRPAAQLMKAPLLFEPDTDYKYSSHAFNFLASVIEGVSGMSYRDYMQQMVFEPLGMKQTFPENIDALTDLDSQIYYLKKGKLVEERWTDNSYALPGAGFRSTPTDLLKMMQGYENGFISKEAVSKLFASHSLKNGTKTQVGITWRTSYDVFGHKTIEHAGNWMGARTVVVHYPEEHLSVAIMMNAGRQILIEEMAHVIAQVFRNSIENTHKPVLYTTAEIDVIFRSKGRKEHYTGALELNGPSGRLKVNTDGFLKSNKMYHLGSDADYAMVSDFGLLFVNVQKETTLKGALYFYGTMNAENPTKREAMVSFTASPK